MAWVKVVTALQLDLSQQHTLEFQWRTDTDGGIVLDIEKVVEASALQKPPATQQRIQQQTEARQQPLTAPKPQKKHQSKKRKATKSQQPPTARQHRQHQQGHQRTPITRQQRNPLGRTEPADEANCEDSRTPGQDTELAQSLSQTSRDLFQDFNTEAEAAALESAAKAVAAEARAKAAQEIADVYAAAAARVAAAAVYSSEAAAAAAKSAAILQKYVQQRKHCCSDDTNSSR